MGIHIEIQDNFLDVAELFAKHQKHIVAAARFSINRSLLTVRQESIPMIRKNLNMGVTAVRKRAEIERTRGGGFRSLVGSVDYSVEPVRMIEFVKGSKQPIKQKGIPVRKRRKLKVEVRPGKRIKLPGAFIQRKKSIQVFRRMGTGRFRKQSVPSIGWVVFNRDGIHKKLVKVGQDRFKELFFGEVQKRIDGTVKTFNNSKSLK